VLAALAVGLLCNVGFVYFHLALEAAAPGQQTPDLLPLVGRAELYTLIDALGQAGRAAYMPIADLDMIYPVVYGVFLSLALAWGLGKRALESQLWRVVLLLPLVGVIADYIENLSARSLLAGWPERADGVASVWVYAHAAKWSALLPALVLLLVIAIKKLVAARKTKADVTRADPTRADPTRADPTRADPP
jgi:hypothetical protein